MISFKTTSFAISLLTATAFSAATPLRDSIPRERLVSNAEFFRALNLQHRDFASVRNFLATRDTSRALQAVASYFRTRITPRYFFTTSEFRRRLEQFKTGYPGPVKKIIADAQLFIRTYGSDVDWKVPGKDKLGRSHTPNTVRFLARQSQAENVAFMYYLDHGNKFAIAFLMDQVRDFVRDYESGNTELGANDVFERFYGGHRARNWLSMHNILLSSSDYSWSDQILLLKVLLLHGARLMDVSEKFNWGNHQLVGLTGIYEISLMYPEFPVMQEWNAKATKTIMEHLEKEIPADGFQCERASHYFKLDILNYFRIYQLSLLNGIKFPPVFAERFRAMFDALVAVSMPNKQVPVLQDGQARYQPGSNNVAELPEPSEGEYLSLGAALFGEPTFRFFGQAQFPASLFWFLSDDQIRSYQNLRPKQPHVLSLALPQTQYYVMRTGWQQNDLYLIIDGGIARDKPDHSHGGVLGMFAYAYGDEILPGYPVRYSDPTYQTMKNSLVKSVALVDTLVQAKGWIENKARTGFGRWERLAVPDNQLWMSGSSVDYFSATHNGFEDAGVRYGRSVLFLKPLGWIVVDRFSSSGSHTYKQLWQGDYRADKRTPGATQRLEHSILRVLQLGGSDFEIRNQTVAGTSGVFFEKTQTGDYKFLTLVLPSSISNYQEPVTTSVMNGGSVTTSITVGSTLWVLTESDGSVLNDSGITTNARMLARSTTGTLRTYWLYEAQQFSQGSLGVQFSKRSSFEIMQHSGKGATLTVLKSDADSVRTRNSDGRWRSQMISIGKAVPISTR
jgi:hypothetical protein